LASASSLCFEQHGRHFDIVCANDVIIDFFLPRSFFQIERMLS